MTKAAWLKIALSVLLLAGGVGAASSLGAFDWKGFLAALGSFKPGWIALGAAVSTWQVFWQVGRAWVAFPPKDKPDPALFSRVTAMGQLLNSVTPLRSGDAYKVIRLSAAAVTPSATMAGLFNERLADNLALATLAAWASSDALFELVRHVATTAPVGAITGLALGVAFACGWFFYRGLPQRLRPAIESVRKFTTRVAAFAKSRWFPICFSVSILTWFIDAGTLWCSIRAGGASLSVAHCMACVFILNLGLAIPLTVANVGIYEAALGFALVGKGLPVGLALGIATVEHSVKLVGLVLCLAVVSAWRRKGAPTLASPAAATEPAG